jgi:leucyl aminopeptidase
VEFSIKSGSPEKQRSACVVVGVFEPRKLTLAAELLDNAARNHLSDIIRRGDMEGKAAPRCCCTMFRAPSATGSCWSASARKRSSATRSTATQFAAPCGPSTKPAPSTAPSFLTETSVRKRSAAWRVRQATIVAQETVYRFDQFKSKKDKVRRPLRKLTFVVDRRNELAAAEEALQPGSGDCRRHVTLAKNLANLPANVCTPAYLAETAQKMAAEYKLECQILERDEMAALGMHSLLAVAKGSQQPPKLIVLQHKGGKADDKPVVLVGKGVTFDTGGISLKPAAGNGRDEVRHVRRRQRARYHQGGGAMMKLPINLTVDRARPQKTCPAAPPREPGDIVTSMSGQTIEILNTDAEGRLILCDALTYAARFRAGHGDRRRHPHRRLRDRSRPCRHRPLCQQRHPGAGTACMPAKKRTTAPGKCPCGSDYQELLKSPFADMANIGGRWGGSITAACFSRPFTKKYVWAHLDIAGTAWKSGTDKGATGRPVPLLMHYLLKRAGKLN